MPKCDKNVFCSSHLFYRFDAFDFSFWQPFLLLLWARNEIFNRCSTNMGLFLDLGWLIWSSLPLLEIPFLLQFLFFCRVTHSDFLLASINAYIVLDSTWILQAYRNDVYQRDANVCVGSFEALRGKGSSLAQSICHFFVFCLALRIDWSDRSNISKPN